ncbi:hypothetical protein [Flavobacterium ardleyense]|uniref:hypothetical protein n=1 Tax=Flavobacterium ardleyense TaxID=2038737 RepID=UPI00298CD89F|nr:hypothetical protein [Flavobacterium ardleyense]
MSNKISFSEKSYKRTIQQDLSFLLLGNNIDGYVNVQNVLFTNYADLILRLPKILYNLECSGEWELKLYQVKDDYKIIKKYGYFKVPNKGKLIYRHDYMDYPVKQMKFDKTKIEIVGALADCWENWEAKENEDFVDYEVDIEVIKIYTC